MSSGTGDPRPKSEPLANQPEGFDSTSEAACIVTLESLEHAEKRNAEILAEIEDYGAPGTAMFTHLADDAADVDQGAQAASTAPESSQDAAGRFSISAATSRHSLKRIAAAVFAFILVLLAGLYRQELRSAVDETRRALAAILASPPPHNTDTQGPLAPGVNSKEARTKKRQASKMNPAPVQHPRAAEESSVDGAIAVVVQPGDDLRQICLRYLGRYDLRLVAKVRELNPNLVDPDVITVGQRILLPAPGGGESTN
jgi:LysM domain